MTGGIRDRAGLKTEVGAKITDGSASTSPQDVRDVGETLSDSAVLFGEHVVRVIDMSTTTPPGSPADRDAHVVAATATGAWTGWENDIAVWDAQAAPPAWVRVPRFDGMLVWNLADDKVWAWDAGLGTPAWVEAFVRPNRATTLIVGYDHTPGNLGTISSGTLTPDEANGSMQKVVNGGAFTLDPPANSTSIHLVITNGASAGAIATGNFTITTGDAFTLTSGHVFGCTITRNGTFSHLHVTAGQ